MDTNQIIEQLTKEIHKSLPEYIPEQLYRAIDNSKLYLFRYFPKQKLMIMSERTSKRFHIPTVFTGMPESYADSCVAEEDRHCIHEICATFDRGEDFISSEFRSTNSDAYIRINLSAVEWDDDHMPEVCMGIIEEPLETDILHTNKLKKIMNDNSDLEQRLSVILNGLAGGFRIAPRSAPFEHIYVSESLAHYLGYEVDEMDDFAKIGPTAYAHPDEMEEVTKSVMTQLSTGTSFTQKHRMLTKSGTYKWILESGKIVHDDVLGEVVYCLYQDIDELEKSREEANSLLDMQNRIVEALSCGVFAYTMPEREILIFNKEAKRVFGYNDNGSDNLSEAMAKHVLSEDRIAIRDLLSTLQNVGDSVDYRFQSIIGEEGNLCTVSCRAQMLALPDGHQYILTVLQDTTLQEAQTELLTQLSLDQTRSAELLERERTYYRNALTHGCEFCYSFDVTTGYITEPIIASDGLNVLNALRLTPPVSYNALIVRIIAWKKYRLLEDFMQPLLTTEGLLERYNAGDSTVEFEYYSPEDDSYFNNTIFMFQDPQTQHIHALVLGRNTTALRKREALQRQQLQNALTSEQQKTKIISGISEIYFSIFHVRVDIRTFTLISAPARVEKLLCDTHSASEGIRRYVEAFVDEKHRTKVTEFCQLSTLSERMYSNKMISCECLSIEKRWVRCSFIDLRRDDSGVLSEVLYVLEDIDAIKSKELNQQTALEEALQDAEQANIAKSNFLANMSHEIRTPMNAVLGMADLALREEMSPTALDYIHQIKNSGKNLLVIINDILDYSKIESGKMDIVSVSYEPLSLINDLSNIVNTRIGGRNIEFVMDIDPRLPYKLYGDNIRIEQILINLLNNAVKFTREGEVRLTIRCDFTDAENVTILADISDTGNGIKEEDLGKLFQSFQQVDSKRNRGVEGTGLGLSISKKLLDLMNGSISVSSVYNQGSTFSFLLPQTILQPFPAIRSGKALLCAVKVDGTYVKEQLSRDFERVDIIPIELNDFVYAGAVNPNVLIFDEKYYTEELKDYLLAHPEVKGLMIAPYDSSTKQELPNLRVLHKPVHSFLLYAALDLCDEYVRESDMETESYSFTAPTAKVLIVDDTPINLTVATGLLEPLKMQVHTANGAAQTIDLVRDNMYDIIFMDHMMPEVDGIETTHIIRRLIPNYANVPIIALTANAVGDAKDMFLREGMNDFIAKPIEIKEITAKVRKWLPKDKIIISDAPIVEAEQPGSNIHIAGLDAQAAIKLLGSEDIFWTILKTYYKSIDKDAKLIREFCEKEQIKDYTVKVHALKSCSRQIGAMELSQLAETLENAGHSNDLATIQALTETLITRFLEFKEILAPYFPEEESGSRLEVIPTPLLLECFDKILTALDELDMTAVEDIVETLSGYHYELTSAEYFEQLKEATDSFDVDAATEIIERWRAIL